MTIFHPCFSYVFTMGLISSMFQVGGNISFPNFKGGISQFQTCRDFGLVGGSAFFFPLPLGDSKIPKFRWSFLCLKSFRSHKDLACAGLPLMQYPMFIWYVDLKGQQKVLHWLLSKKKSVTLV